MKKPFFQAGVVIGKTSVNKADKRQNNKQGKYKDVNIMRDF